MPDRSATGSISSTVGCPTARDSDRPEPAATVTARRHRPSSMTQSTIPNQVIVSSSMPKRSRRTARRRGSRHRGRRAPETQQSTGPGCRRLLRLARSPSSRSPAPARLCRPRSVSIASASTHPRRSASAAGRTPGTRGVPVRAPGPSPIEPSLVAWAGMCKASTASASFEPCRTPRNPSGVTISGPDGVVSTVAGEVVTTTVLLVAGAVAGDVVVTSAVAAVGVTSSTDESLHAAPARSATHPNAIHRNWPDLRPLISRPCDPPQWRTDGASTHPSVCDDHRNSGRAQRHRPESGSPPQVQEASHRGSRDETLPAGDAARIRPRALGVHGVDIWASLRLRTLHSWMRIRCERR